MPKDHEALPIYSRDAELFVGSIERLEDWLAGVKWARDYDMMLRLSDDKKRNGAEQKQRNRNLMQSIKQSKMITGTIE